MIMKGRQLLCHGCQSREYLKIDCSQAKHPNVDVEAVGESGLVVKEIHKTGSTIAVEPIAVETVIGKECALRLAVEIVLLPR